MTELEKLKKNKEITYMAWDKHCQVNGCRMTPLERFLSKKAYAAYHAYETAKEI